MATYCDKQGKTKRRAEYNANQIGEFNRHNKEKGIRNYFRRLHDEFHWYLDGHLTYKGSGIQRTLFGYGSIDTPDYDLKCITGRNKIEIIENGKVIYTVKKKADFDGTEAYSRISYDE